MNALAELRGYAGRALGPDAPDYAAHWKLSMEGAGRKAAVLMLFGPSEGMAERESYSPEDLDVLLLRRAPTLNAHAGEVAFPGGSVDATDVDHVHTALREAQEETGLDPEGVEVLGTLPVHPLPHSRFLVTPVLGWWRRPSPVHAVDQAESTSVFRMPVRELLDPGNRVTASLTRGGTVFNSPAFDVNGTFIWGFTGKLLDETLHFIGWEKPWDEGNLYRFTR